MVDKAIFDIKMLMDKPYYKPETSLELRAKANRQRDIATVLKLQGRAVKEPWQ